MQMASERLGNTKDTRRDCAQEHDWENTRKPWKCTSTTRPKGGLGAVDSPGERTTILQLVSVDLLYKRLDSNKIQASMLLNQRLGKKKRSRAVSSSSDDPLNL